jgi:hypothetical protein
MLVGMPVNEESLRKAGVLKYVPSLGAILAPCDRCAQPTWLGPKQREIKRARPEIEFICANCCAADVKTAQVADPNVEVTVQNCGGKSGSYFLTDGTAILPTPPKQN